MPWLNWILRYRPAHFALAGFAGWLLLAAPAQQGEWREPVTLGPERIEALRAGWAAATGREPDEAELQSLQRQEIDDEILFREALARSLHRLDPVVKQRLVLNMRFLDPQTRAGDEATLRAGDRARHAGQRRRGAPPPGPDHGALDPGGCRPFAGERDGTRRDVREASRGVRAAGALAHHAGLFQCRPAQGARARRCARRARAAAARGAGATGGARARRSLPRRPPAAAAERAAARGPVRRGVRARARRLRDGAVVRPHRVELRRAPGARGGGRGRPHAGPGRARCAPAPRERRAARARPAHAGRGDGDAQAASTGCKS
jgi:hypothetical protein